MSTVDEITAALARLGPADRAAVRAWLDADAPADAEDDDWDRQIAADEAAGRLDALADAALAEHRAGRTRPL